MPDEVQIVVARKDGTIRFCVGYCKVNDVSQFDAYPMPWVNKLLDQLGTALFLQHWIWPRATGRFPCLQGLKTRRPSPTRMVCTNSLRFHLGYSGPRPLSSASWIESYQGDVIINSVSWAEHMQQVALVLESLWCAGLMAHPKWEKREVERAQESSARWVIGQAGTCLLITVSLERQ